VPHGRRGLTPSCGGKGFQSRCRAVRVTATSGRSRADLLLLLACQSVHPYVPFGGSGLESGMSVTTSRSVSEHRRGGEERTGSCGRRLGVRSSSLLFSFSTHVQQGSFTVMLDLQSIVWRAVLLLVLRADDFLERAGGGARSSANERFSGKENGMCRAGPWPRRERRVIHVSHFGPWAF
jgi:hypothetical protein